MIPVSHASFLPWISHDKRRHSEPSEPWRSTLEPRASTPGTSPGRARTSRGSPAKWDLSTEQKKGWIHIICIYIYMYDIYIYIYIYYVIYVYIDIHRYTP